MITTSNYEKTIEHQFDSFCKTVIRNFARDIYDENKWRNERLVSLEALTMAELSQLSIFDDYDSNGSVAKFENQTRPLWTPNILGCYSH